MGKCAVCGAKGNEIIVKSLVDAEPPPTEGTGPAIWDLVISDLHGQLDGASPRRQRILKLMIQDSYLRDQFGQKKYGKRLRDQDGLVDGYQEILDLAVYLRKEIETYKFLKKEETPNGSNIKELYTNSINLWRQIRTVLYERDGK